MHRNHKWPGRFLGARDSCGASDDVIFKCELHTNVIRLGEGGIVQQHSLHFPVYSLHTFVQLTNPAKLDECSGYTWISRIAGCSHTVQCDDVESFARFHLYAVVSQDSDACLRHHDGGVLREQKSASNGQFPIAYEPPAFKHLLV